MTIASFSMEGIMTGLGAVAFHRPRTGDPYVSIARRSQVAICYVDDLNADRSGSDPYWRVRISANGDSVEFDVKCCSKEEAAEVWSSIVNETSDIIWTCVAGTDGIERWVRTPDEKSSRSTIPR